MSTLICEVSLPFHAETYRNTTIDRIVINWISTPSLTLGFPAYLSIIPQLYDIMLFALERSILIFISFYPDQDSHYINLYEKDILYEKGDVIYVPQVQIHNYLMNDADSFWWSTSWHQKFDSFIQNSTFSAFSRTCEKQFIQLKNLIFNDSKNYLIMDVCPIIAEYCCIFYRIKGIEETLRIIYHSKFDHLDRDEVETMVNQSNSTRKVCSTVLSKMSNVVDAILILISDD